MKKSLIISLLISLGIGGLSGIITSGSMDLYKYLVKPPLSPPGIVFIIVWSILYVLMGISAYKIYESKNIGRDKALIVYITQLFLNFIWPILFFTLNYRFVSFIWILILFITILIMITKFYKINKLSAYLQLPYLFWVVFACYLNLGFYILNM